MSMQQRLIIALSLLIICLHIGCGRDNNYRYNNSSNKPKPFPRDKLMQARDLMDKGSRLFAQALDADTQQEKNSLVREARESYFYPAQEILDKLKEEHPEEYEIERVYQELNRRILDATRIDGIGD